MPQGPGENILHEIESGTSDNLIISKYKVSADELKAFKSLNYGISNQKIGFNEISDYYPELNKYFKGPAAPAPIAEQKVTPASIEKPDFTKPVHEKMAVESTAAPVAPAAKRAAEIGNVGESLREKFDKELKPAHERINNELNQNDDLVTELIKEGRYNKQREKDLTHFAQAARTDMPAAAMLALDRNRMIEPETKPQDLPVTIEDVGEAKNQIQNDEGSARQFLNRLAVKKPDKAKDLQSSLYLLDANARMQENLENGVKVFHNYNDIKNGAKKYNAATKQVIEEQGFWKSIVTGVRENTRQLENYDLFQQSDDKVIELLEKRRAQYDPDAPVPVPTGAGEIGQMTGMEWKALVKGGVLSAIATASGTEAAAPWVTAAVNAPEYYKRGYSTALEDTYDQARKQGKSPQESLKLAQEQARYEGKLGAAEGAISSFIGGRIGLKDLPKYNITGGFKNAVTNILKQTGHFATEASVDGLADGLVAGYLQDKKDAAAIEKGQLRDSEKNIKDNVVGELMFSFAIGAVTKAGQVAADPETYKKLWYYLGNQPKETVDAKIGQMVLDGNISQEDANEVTEKLKEQRKVDQTVPDDIKDVSRMAMIDKINRRQELEKQLETTDEALHPPIKEEIKKLNEEILEHSKHKKTETDESKTKTETQAETGDGSVLKTTEPALDQKMSAGESAPASENPSTEESTPIKEYQYTNDAGTEYVLRDEKLYYKKTNGEEVQYSEKAMQQPATKELIEKIKSEGNAIQEQGVTEVPVHASPSDSEQVGQGNENQGPVNKETTGTQKINNEEDLTQAVKSYSEKTKAIADKLRSLKRGGKGEAYGGLLGVTVAVYDGMLETAAKVLETGGTLADAIKAAVNHIKQHDPSIPEDEIRKAIEKEFSDNKIIGIDKEAAIENIIKNTPSKISDESLINIIKDATDAPANQIQTMVDAIRKPPIPPGPLTPTSALTPQSRNVSLNKFKNLFNVRQEKKPNWFQRQWESLKNASAWIDNPYRFITKITEDINKAYKVNNKEAIPLGRQFEKSSAGRAILKVDKFINEVIRGNINGKKLGKLTGEKYQDFQKYLAAKRVLDRLNKQEEKLMKGEVVNRQTGNITAQDAQVQLETLETKYGDLNDFAERAKAFHEHMDNMLKTLVAAGILSEEQYNNIKADNDFYAPFSVVQEKLLAGQDKQPVGVSGIVKRIKGIDYALPKTKGDALAMMDALGAALQKGIISPEEYFNTALEILNDVRNNGIISDKEYDNYIAGLENPGFALNDILDAAANMIYKAEGMALKNRMLQRLLAYKKFDTNGLFIQDVEGFEPRTLPNGEVRMIPKPLNAIKVEPGMAPIKLKVDGKDKFVAVNEKAADKLTTINNYEIATWMKVSDAINRIFRTFVITLSPGFQAVNFMIDFVRTTMLSRYGPLAGKGLLEPAVNAIMFMPQYIEALLHSALGNVGIKTGAYKQWMESDSFSKGMFDNLFDNEKRIKEVNAPLAKRLLLNFLKLKFIDIPGSILEQTHKLATYQRGLSVEGFKPEMFTAMLSSIINRNINENMSAEELKDAMDRLNYEVQNFAGSPNFPQTHRWMKLASIFLQFFSARVKGEVTDYRRVLNLFTGKGEGVKLSKQDVFQIGSQFIGAAGAIAAYAILNNYDDEDEKAFDGIAPYHKDNYLNIPAGEFEYKTTDADGNEQKQTLRDYFKIPLRGLTATMNVVANSFVKFIKRENPEEFKKMAEAFLGNASPVNLNGSDERELGESTVSNLTPVFKFFLEYSFNRDTHSHRDIIPDTHGYKSMLAKYKRGQIMPYEVYTDKTPEWAKEMSKFLYEKLGISINAITLDHMENTMGNPTELYDKAIEKRLWRSKMKYPLYTPKTPQAEMPEEPKPIKE